MSLDTQALSLANANALLEVENQNLGIVFADLTQMSMHPNQRPVNDVNIKNLVANIKEYPMGWVSVANAMVVIAIGVKTQEEFDAKLVQREINGLKAWISNGPTICIGGGHRYHVAMHECQDIFKEKIFIAKFLPDIFEHWQIK